MIAVIETGGKQYTVSKGDVILVEKLPEETGKTVVFSHVLLLSENGNTEIGTPFLDVTVEGKVVEHDRGKKIRVFKVKAKKRYRKTQGHRQDYTKVEIVSIGKKAPRPASKKTESVEAKVKKETTKKVTTTAKKTSS